jgi:hypothetical protein
MGHEDERDHRSGPPVAAHLRGRRRHRRPRGRPLGQPVPRRRRRHHSLGPAPPRQRPDQRPPGGRNRHHGRQPPARPAADRRRDRPHDRDRCSRPADQIQATSTSGAKRACPDAIVGSGSATVEVAFPEQEPFSSTGPVVLFNGGVRGKTTTVLLHAYVDVPAPTAIVVPARVVRVDDGQFGLEILAKIPRIAGGAGSVTGFELTVGRRFSVAGERHSLLTAGCPSGHWRTAGEAEFADGTVLSIDHVFPCTPIS